MKSVYEIIMKHLLLLGLLIALTPMAADAAKPYPFHNALSLQGYTGAFNTPSARVTDEGWLYAVHSNQIENNIRGRVRSQDNYLFSVGMFNFVELGGRLSYASGIYNDLSANAKISSAALTRNYPLMPVIALGMQDVSGGASHFKTKYLVITEDLRRLRLSAGYGDGPDRMKGVFGSAEFKARDWLYLLGEYDTKETNLGVRLVLPQFWKIPLSFTATAKTSLDYKPGNFDIAVGFSLPLDFELKGEKAKTTPSSRVEKFRPASDHNVRPPVLEKSVNSAINESQTPPPEASDAKPKQSPLETLRDRLVKGGFQNVRVGTTVDAVVVEYENSVYNHSELDALGVVLGLVADSGPEDVTTAKVVIKKKNISMLQLVVPVRALKSFMGGASGAVRFRENLIISSRIDSNDGTSFIGGEGNSGMLATSLAIWPGLKTWVGTEHGSFDYLLSLKPELFVNLWQGAMLNARWDLPIAWSSNLDLGKPYRSSRTPERLERLMMFQGVKILPDVMVNLGAGMLLNDLYGTMNEAVWQPGSGQHRIRLSQVWGNDNNSRKDTQSYLASYRYYFAPLDLSLEGTAGRYWSDDRGFSLEMKRYFGDTAFSVFYKNSTITKESSLGLPTHWQTVGVQFAFPLTPRKDMQHYYKMQLKGSEEWRYGQETTIASGNSANANYLPPVPIAAAPAFTGSLHNQFFDRDRLHESYIRAHLGRLREAWMKYGVSLK